MNKQAPSLSSIICTQSWKTHQVSSSLQYQNTRLLASGWPSSPGEAFPARGRWRTGEPKGIWELCGPTCQFTHILPKRLFPCSSSPRHPGSIPDSSVISHCLPPWAEVFENKECIMFGSITPAPNRIWYTVYAEQMMWGWTELYMRSDTRHVETNILVQICILTDRSSVLKRLD